MHILERKTLSFLRILHQKLVRPTARYDGISNNFADASVRNQAASDLIKKRLTDNRPLMIARFGATEISYLTNSLIVNDWFLRKKKYYVQNKINSFGWEPQIIHDMIHVSGFFPHTEGNAIKYAQLCRNDIKCVDILGSWL